jgi:hypothetical protein
MKTRYVNMKWLVSLAGIAVVAATVVVAKTYFDLEQEAEAAAAFGATSERLCQDQRLSLVLKDIHDGDTKSAAERLDLILCGNILRTEGERASADAQTGAYIEAAFRRIATTRPLLVEGGGAGASRESGNDQIAAQHILAKALATLHTAQAH